MKHMNNGSDVYSGTREEIDTVIKYLLDSEITSFVVSKTLDKITLSVALSPTVVAELKVKNKKIVIEDF